MKKSILAVAVSFVLSGAVNAGYQADGSDQFTLFVYNSTLYGMGYSPMGGMGPFPTKVNELIPIELGIKNVKSVSVQENRSLVLLNDGRLVFMGLNPTTGFVESPHVIDRNVTDMALARSQALYIKGGVLYGWNYQSIIAPVAGLPMVTQVSSGLDHSGVVDGNGNAWTWGIGPYDTTDPSISLSPTTTGALVSELAVGSDHTLALSNGKVWAWGYNSNGQVGNGSTKDQFLPVMINQSAQFAHVYARNQSAAIDTVGQLWVWGPHYYTGFNDVKISYRPYNTKDRLPVFNNTQAGLGDSLGIAFNSGSIYAFGKNQTGRLGTGDIKDHPFPVMILNSAMITTQTCSPTLF